MRLYKNIIRKCIGRLSAIAALTSIFFLQSCDMIKDESDCYQSYNLVRLVYDHNMKFADAFDSEVKAVTLLAFNSETGRLVKRIDAPHSALNEDNELVLDVAPGKYDIIVWGGEHPKSFAIATGTEGESQMQDFHCRMNRLDEQGTANVREDLAPLWHGQIDVELPYASPSKPNRITVPLKKDTNTFRVVLQHISGEAVNCDDFDFTITDSNGWMNHDNSLREDVDITYHPWYTFSGAVDINTNPTPAPGSRSLPEAFSTRSALGASLAEFTTSRLLTDRKPILTVTNKKENKVVLSIPVIDYALLVKGFYHKDISDQEYLDRQDEYNMTFFLDEGNRWLSAVIIINDWRIVRHETPIE